MFTFFIYKQLAEMENLRKEDASEEGSSEDHPQVDREEEDMKTVRTNGKTSFKTRQGDSVTVDAVPSRVSFEEFSCHFDFNPRRSAAGGRMKLIILSVRLSGR